MSSSSSSIGTATSSSTSTNNNKNKSGFSKEEEKLLKNYSRNISATSSALFYGNAAIVSTIPIWLFWRIHQMEPNEFYIYFAIGILLSTYLLSKSYLNVKYLLKHKILIKREQAIIKEINLKDTASNDKKLSKQDKDERIEWTKNQVSDYESTTFSIFYNNSLFLLILLIASFLIFKNFAPQFNYLLSMGSAAGLIALFSTSSK